MNDRIKTLLRLGNAITILLYINWCDNPVGEKEISDAFNMSRTTIRKQLRLLHGEKLIIRIGRYDGWIINHSRQLIINYPSVEEDNNSKDSNYPSVEEDNNSKDSNYPSVEEDNKSKDSNYPSIEVSNNSKDSNYPSIEESNNSKDSNYPSNDGKDRLYPSERLINITTINGKIRNNKIVVNQNKESLNQSLIDANIYGAVRLELLDKEGLTSQIVKNYERKLRHDKGARYTAGLLVHCLRKLDPFEVNSVEKDDENDRKKYVRGEYAEYINC